MFCVWGIAVASTSPQSPATALWPASCPVPLWVRTGGLAPTPRVLPADCDRTPQPPPVPRRDVQSASASHRYACRWPGAPRPTTTRNPAGSRRPPCTMPSKAHRGNGSPVDPLTDPSCTGPHQNAPQEAVGSRRPWGVLRSASSTRAVDDEKVGSTQTGTASTRSTRSPSGGVSRHRRRIYESPPARGARRGTDWVRSTRRVVVICSRTVAVLPTA